ncbi:MAG: FprA family A-type flavoprotein [Bacteroidales bacterium]|nr:FprA family A-type flavoprotein [Bacteroidales bacterium]
MIISNKVHYVGTNDRKKHLFENNWPLPYGVSYNSYLIADEHTALIDTIEYGSNPDYLRDIDLILEGRPLEYLIVNHLEPDHSSMIGEVLRAYPSVKIVSNPKTFQLLKNYYPLGQENIFQIKEGDVLELGYHKLTFVLVPWVHWPETMVTYDTTDQILFSCDAFGSFGALDGGIFDDTVNFELFYENEMRRYYSNIVGKWSNMVQKAFAKLAGVPIRFICPSHGVIWRENPGKVLALYDKWSKYEAQEGFLVCYASMYGNTEKFAEAIARKLSEKGIKEIRVIDVSKTHVSYILSDIWKYKGLVLGSCAYNCEMHPMMAMLTHEISISAPKNRVLGIFGGSTWNGAGAKDLRAWAEKVNMPVTAGSAEFMGRPFAQDLEQLDAFAQALVDEIRK